MLEPAAPFALAVRNDHAWTGFHVGTVAASFVPARAPVLLTLEAALIATDPTQMNLTSMAPAIYLNYRNCNQTLL